MPFVEIDISMDFQRRSHYCYAAVVQAVIRYYTGQDISQKEIAASLGKGYQDPADFLAPLNLIRAKSATQIGYAGIPSWSTVVAEVNAGRPIIVYVGGCHYVLLIGYEGKSARDPQRLYIFLDPLFPVPQAVSYSVLKEHGYSIEETIESVRGYYLTAENH